MHNSSRPLITISGSGRMANQMFKAMLATELKRRVPNAMIAGLSLPEWGLTSPPVMKVEPSLILQGHRFNLDEAAYYLRTGTVRNVVIEGWAMRLNYYGKPSQYRGIFKPKVKGYALKDHQLLVHIRAEDIISGFHRLYFPLDFSFYEHVIDTAGLHPVFMGQLDENPYVTALRSRFKGATFLPPASPVEDFETLRNARSVVLSVSSFAWLAAWLSEFSESIHLPVAGLFDPRLSNTLLLPFGDRRYHFYDVDFPDMQIRGGLSVVDWANQPRKVSKLRSDDISKAILGSILSG